MDDAKLELKVGALLLASIAGGLALLWTMGELSFGSGHSITVDFSHTGNVVKGAPVKLGGVAIGRVDRIALLPDRRDAAGQPLPVQMIASITPDAARSLREDALITVSSQGPLGEPYLELWPGVEKAPLGEKSVIRGLDAPRIDIVANRLAKFLETASKVLESDPDAVSKLIKGVGGLTNTVDGVLTENRDDIRDIARELGTTAKDLRSLAATAKSLMEPGGKGHALLDDAATTAKLARTDLPELSRKASLALGGLAAVSGSLTEEDGKRLKATLGRANEISEKLDGMATRADVLLRRLENGDGTLGALAKDKVVYDDLKSLLAELRKHPWKMLWKD